MKHIRKTHPPPALREWLRDNQDFDHSYAALQGSLAHHALKAQLLREQGFLCAYTGVGIDGDTSHVEHLKPQNQCAAGEDVDYRNVVACFPADGGDVSHGFGAPVKGGWWDEALFVSPLSPECERRFRFSWSGKVAASPPDHGAATQTILRLGLDSRRLVALRHDAIQGFFGFTSRPGRPAQPLSHAEARRLVMLIDQPDAEGRLRPFCFVLKQLLARHGAVR